VQTGKGGVVPSGSLERKRAATVVLQLFFLVQGKLFGFVISARSFDIVLAHFFCQPNLIR